MLKVLLADDSKPYREALKSLLDGIPGVRTVGEAEDARAAVVMNERLRPDVVVLNVRMPGESGIGALRRIKAKPGGPPVVIMLTDYPYPQIRERCLQMGADYFFEKSGEIDQIIDTIKGLAETGG